MIGGLLIVAFVLGGVAWYRYKLSERHIKAQLAHFQAVGATLSTDQCIGQVLQWHAEGCDAMLSLCDSSLPMALVQCLGGADRQADCATAVNEDPKGHWTFKMCEARGISKKHGSARAHIKACGNAYGALQNYCLNDQRGVSL